MVRTRVSSTLCTYCVTKQNKLKLGFQVADHNYSVVYFDNNLNSSKSKSIQLSSSNPTSKTITVYRISKRKHLAHLSVVGDD